VKKKLLGMVLGRAGKLTKTGEQGRDQNALKRSPRRVFAPANFSEKGGRSLAIWQKGRLAEKGGGKRSFLVLLGRDFEKKGAMVVRAVSLSLIREKKGVRFFPGNGESLFCFGKKSFAKGRFGGLPHGGETGAILSGLRGEGDLLGECWGKGGFASCPSGKKVPLFPSGRKRKNVLCPMVRGEGGGKLLFFLHTGGGWTPSNLAVGSRGGGFFSVAGGKVRSFPRESV